MIKCGYWRLKCKSKSVSSNADCGVPQPAVPQPPVLPAPPPPPPASADAPPLALPNGPNAPQLLVDEIVARPAVIWLLCDCEAPAQAPPPQPEAAAVDCDCAAVVALFAAEPPQLADDVCGVQVWPTSAHCGTGISCERNVRFELCIFTASDSDVRSAGNGVSNDRREMVSEQSL